MVYQPAAVAPRTTYYAPSLAGPTTTYYAPSYSGATTTYYAPAAMPQAAPVTTYYAPAATVYYAPPATPTQMNQYHSSVSSMPVGSVRFAPPAFAAAPVPVGAPPVAELAPPVIAYRPVMAVPQSYIVTRGLFGRPHLYPVGPAPVVPVYVP